MIKNRIFKNIGVGIGGKISIIIFRVIQVPFFITVLGAKEYGIWIVLYSLPSWLLLANMGFGSVASNEMSMNLEGNKVQNARIIYSTTFFLITFLSFVGLIVLLIIVPLIKWYQFLDQLPQRNNEIIQTIIFLSGSIFISFYGELFGGVLKANKKNHIYLLFASFKPWIEFFVILIITQFSHKLSFLSFAVLLATLIYTIVLKILSNNGEFKFQIKIKDISKDKIRFLFKKGIAFQSIPLSNALLFQGSLLVIQSILGATSVTIFSTVRILVRTINQSMELINYAIWPELSFLFGKEDYEKAAILHRIGVSISVSISILGVIFMAIFGVYLYEFWVDEKLLITRKLLFIFLLSIPLNALWNTSSIVHIASNNYEGLGKRYLFAAVISIILCAILSYFFSIEGAAISTVFADLILIPYVFSYSLFLTHDTQIGFFNGIYCELHKIVKKIKLHG